MKFDDDAFVPLLSHPTHVRWTSSTSRVLEADELATIAPMTAAAAGALFPRAELLRRALGSSRRKPNAVVLRLAPETPQDAIAWVLAQAGKRRPKPQDIVYVSWDPETAVRTRWSTFAEHWPSFCREGTDDVVVLPEASLADSADAVRDALADPPDKRGAPWILFHHYEGRFYLR